MKKLKNGNVIVLEELGLKNYPLFSWDYHLCFYSPLSIQQQIIVKKNNLKIVSTIHQNMGYVSLASLYLVFSLSNFISPTIESFLGPRVCLIVAGFIYTSYTLFAAFPYRWAIIVSSVLVGFAASLLWISQGDYLTKISKKENMGTNSGIFLGLFFSSMILGNILISTLFVVGLQQYIIFLILFSLGVFGVVLMFFLRPEPKISSNKRKSIIGSIKCTCNVLIDTRMILLMGLIIYSGYSSSIFLGKVPEIIGKELGKSYIGFTMSTFGIAELLGSIFFGFTSDKFGKKIMMFFTIFIHVLAISWSFIMMKYPPYSYFISTFLNGFADSGMNTNLYSILGNVFNEQPSNAFASFKFVQSVSFTMGFIGSIYLKFFALQILSYFLLTFALYTFMILDYQMDGKL